MSVTIKQVLIGALLGSSVVGIMVHRMRKDPQVIKQLALANTQSRLHKSRKHSKGSDTQLSSNKVYG